MNRATINLFAVTTVALLLATSARADLASQYGILDLTANGGINPNTGLAWVAGDQYRLAFHTDETIDATSNDPAVYDNFATAQAQQNTALVDSTGWTAMLWVNTDGTQEQGVGPISNPLVRSGTDDLTGGAGQLGAGVPVYAMDGTTAIARNNADIYNSWSNPFETSPGVADPTGNGNNVMRIDTGDINSSPHYSPFLDQFGSGDTGAVHGADCWTGGFGSHVNAAGDTPSEVRTSHGNTNANRTGRVWNRFNRDNFQSKALYVISELLTIEEAFYSANFNSDGIVDDKDMNLLLSDYDPNGSGLGEDYPPSPYNPEHLALTLEQFGTDGLGTGSAQQVPEPASMALLLFGALGLLGLRRRK